jgi:hypothetical protein
MGHVICLQPSLIAIADKVTMMLRLWPFAPAFVVFLGAILVAGGSFWAGFRQSNFNAEIRAKNEQIATLQQENIRILRGSDFFHFTVLLLPNSDGTFPLMSINRSDLPVYDVCLNIRSHVDLPVDTPEHQAEAMHYMLHPDRVELGTVPPGAKQTNVLLAPGYYQIDIAPDMQNIRKWSNLTRSVIP